jgi:hypothetical protein
MKAQEFNKMACAANWDKIKNQYAAIMSKCEAAARKGEFAIELKYKEVPETIHNQLKNDGFVLNLKRNEEPNIDVDDYIIRVYFPAQKPE